MSYELRKTYDKTDTQTWDYVSISNTAMNYTYDPRDKNEISEDKKPMIYNWYRSIKEQLGQDYIGWDREYVGNNSLIITHYIQNENSARLFYNADTNSPASNTRYVIRWDLKTDTGEFLTL